MATMATPMVPGDAWQRLAESKLHHLGFCDGGTRGSPGGGAAQGGTKGARKGMTPWPGLMALGGRRLANVDNM